MASTAVKTTDIEINDSTVHLSNTQKAYVDNSIAKGLADMEAGRGLSDPDEIEKDIQRRFELKKQAYLKSLK